MSDSDVAVIMLDMSGHICGWTTCAERLIGWSAQDVVCLSHDIFYPPEKRLIATLALQGARSGEFREKTICVRKDGSTFRAEISVTALYDAEATVRGYVNLIHDISRADAKQAQDERTAVLGQLAGGMAHDFNNILQVITGNASMIQASPDATIIQRCVGRMIKAADRGAAISGRLLAFSRSSGNDTNKEVDIKALFDSIQELLGPLLPTNINVVTKAETNLPWVLTDLSQLETVLVNLATNSRDAMLVGGNLVFSAGLCQMDVNNHLGLKMGSYVRIAVTDNGVGMDATMIARSIEPFFSTKAKGRGTGLGLHLARTFAEQSGGALEIVSEPNVSTEVRLWLPVATVVKDTRHHHEIEPVENGIAARVLVVEDDDLVRETMTASLDHDGFITLDAPDGQTALATLSETPIDAVVVDYALPDMNGITVIDEAQRCYNDDLPAILMTGNIGDLLAVNQQFSLLRKPFSPVQLMIAVKSLLSTKRKLLPKP